MGSRTVRSPAPHGARLMLRRQRPPGLLPAVAALVALLLLLSAAEAAPLELRLRPPAMDSRGIITVNGSGVLGHLELSTGLILGYSHRPFSHQGELAGPPWCTASAAVEHACTAGGAEIQHHAMADLQLALGLFGRLEAGIGLPLALWSGTVFAPDGGSARKLDAQGVGDLTLNLKGRLINAPDRLLGLSLALAMTLPTGSAAHLLGAGQPALAPGVILDRELLEGQLHLALNLGARLGLGRDAVHLLTFGGGAALGIVPRRLELVAELVGHAVLAGGDGAPWPAAGVQALVGCKLYLAQSSHLHLALGRGLWGGGPSTAPGLPEISVLLGIIFEPTVGDRDNDGLKDDADRCPDDAEDLDDFEDENGCPDPDNDRDGVLDQDDGCPEVPEDIDGVEDEDGCPDPDPTDRDGDGIEDPRDRCPDDPEDRDKFEDEDGCPDPDNDRDGILDIDDLCPNRPETVNRFEDEDGCPDQLPRIKITKQVLTPLDRIYFETDRAVIRKVSYPTLDTVVWALKNHQTIELLEIQGHADERGTRAHNQRLTEQRAAAVRAYLIAKGIAARRLLARGYGEDRPLQRASTPRAWSRNRRVEFIIIRRAADPPGSSARQQSSQEQDPRRQ